jgi:2-oxoglutarate ferredoxin oxidoreductase subunit beta
VSKVNLGTGKKIQWCPGCGNYAIYSAFKNVAEKNIENGKLVKENLVLISGIGCHGYITNYYDLNSFHPIHGRVPPLATGIKVANPILTVVGFAGDGDVYAEGMNHIIQAARRNTDITMIVHDNSVYGLTTGQFTPTSPQGFKGRSTPFGNPERPINPISLMIVSRATFVARGFSGDLKHLEYLFERAIFHKGFSIVDVIQPCVTFNNTYEYYRERVYRLEDTDYDPHNFENALKKSLEFDGRVPIGVFYEETAPTYEELVTRKTNYYYERKVADVSDIVAEKV